MKKYVDCVQTSKPSKGLQFTASPNAFKPLKVQVETRNSGDTISFYFEDVDTEAPLPKIKVEMQFIHTMSSVEGGLDYIDSIDYAGRVYHCYIKIL